MTISQKSQIFLQEPTLKIALKNLTIITAERKIMSETEEEITAWTGGQERVAFVRRSGIRENYRPR